MNTDWTDADMKRFAQEDAERAADDKERGRSYDQLGQRFYKKGKNISCTSVLKLYCPIQLQEWFKRTEPAVLDRVLKESSELGTRAHKWADFHVRSQMGTLRVGEVAPPIDGILPFIDGILAFERDFKPVYLHSELTAHCDELNVSCTIDWVARIGAEVALGDWKTGELRKKDILQTSMNKRAYIEEMARAGLPDHVDTIALAQIGPKAGAKGYRFVKCKDCFPVYRACLDLWKYENDSPQWEPYEQAEDINKGVCPF